MDIVAKMLAYITPHIKHVKHIYQIHMYSFPATCMYILVFSSHDCDNECDP